MSISTRISAFYDLGQFFSFITGNEIEKNANFAKFEYLNDGFTPHLQSAEVQHAWVTQQILECCLEQWGKVLSAVRLHPWVRHCPGPNLETDVRILIAANLP